MMDRRKGCRGKLQVTVYRSQLSRCQWCCRRSSVHLEARNPSGLKRSGSWYFCLLRVIALWDESDQISKITETFGYTPSIAHFRGSLVRKGDPVNRTVFDVWPRYAKEQYRSGSYWLITHTIVRDVHRHQQKFAYRRRYSKTEVRSGKSVFR